MGDEVSWAAGRGRGGGPRPAAHWPPESNAGGGALRCRTPNRLTKAALEAGGGAVVWDPGAAVTGVGG